MKVVLVNGSRRDAGCTYTALSVVAKELEAQGIDTEIVAVGSRVVKGELDAVVKEVGANFECGISLVNCNDMKVGDMIETFEEIEVKQTL